MTASSATARSHPGHCPRIGSGRQDQSAVTLAVMRHWPLKTSPSSPSLAGGRRLGPRLGRRLGRRLGQLYAGLVLYAVSMALVINSDLGNMPWDVFHQGLARRVGLTIGFWVIAIGLLILLA